MCFLGVDIGTSGVKAVVFDHRWQAISEARAEYSLIYGERGHIELPVLNVLDAVKQVCRECTAHANVSVDAVAFAALGEAIFPIRAGTPLSNAPITADGRTRGFKDWWPQRIDPVQLRNITELPLRDVWSANRLLWWKENDPQLADAPHYRCLEDAVIENLGLKPTMSTSLAARTMMLDTKNAIWSQTILELLSLDVSRLSDVGLPGTKVGRLQDGHGSDFGLKDGTWVALGGHDQACSAIGSGATRFEPMWGTGTVESVVFLSEHPLDGGHPEVPSYQFEPNLRMTAFANLNGGAALKWFVRLLAFHGTDEPNLDLLVRDLSDKPNGIMMLPLFGTTGAPDFDSNVSASIFGLHYSDGPAEIAYAIIEGVTMETRYTLEKGGAPIHDIRNFNLAGGGARSKVWATLKANMLNRPVIRRRYADTGCIGAAIYAFQAVYGSKPDINVVNPVLDIIYPNAELNEKLEDRYSQYLKIRANHKTGTSQ